MESIGKQLHAKRIEKGFTIHQVSQGTRLSSDYIQAFEDEDYTVFPGNSYLIGFLRIYSEHLGLEPDQMIHLYQKTRLQEQPLPITELLRKKPNKKKFIWIFIGAGLLVVLGAIYYLGTEGLVLLQDIFNENPLRQGIIEITERETVEQRVGVGEELQLRIGEEVVSMFIEDIAQSVSLRSGDVFVSLEIGGEYRLDANADGFVDIALQARRIDSIQKRAIISFTRVPSFNEKQTVPPELLASPTGLRNIGPELTEEERQYVEERSRVIVSAKIPRSFSVVLEANDAGFVKIQVDDQLVEQPVIRGTKFNWDATKQFRIWTTNAGALQLQIDEKELILGGAGETVVGTVLWVFLQNEYQLEFIPQF